MFLAEPRGHVDMRDVVASGGVDAVQRFEEDPVLAKVFGDLGEIGAVAAGEAVAQLAEIVAGIGVVESGLAFQRRLAAWRAVLRHRDGEQCVANGAALAQRPAAAARTFQVAGGEVDALRDGAIDLVRIELLQFGGGDRGAEDAEHRTGVEAARHHSGDELRGHALHHLVGGGDARSGTACRRRR